MVKRILLLLGIFFSLANADIYEKNCVSCHKDLPVSIEKYFYKYLLIYSGERDTKNAMLSYLNYPAKETSVMSDAFISRFGIKKKTILSKEELQQAIDTYWEKYKVFEKLK